MAWRYTTCDWKVDVVSSPSRTAYNPTTTATGIDPYLKTDPAISLAVMLRKVSVNECGMLLHNKTGERNVRISRWALTHGEGH
jgi:hypothetical protein